MATFYLTFGQKYRREVHPQLGARPELPDGWLTVEAETEADAQTIVVMTLDWNWSDLRQAHDTDMLFFFPAGNLGTLQQALAHHHGG